MNRQTDHDALLRRWLEEGANAAPERFVKAALQDIETTGQRRLRWTLPRRHGMTIHRYAMYAAAAAAMIVVSAVGLAYVAGPRDTGTQTPSPAATVTPELITSAQLERISLHGGPAVMDGSNAGIAAIYGPDAGLVAGGDDALAALLPPGASTADLPASRGARYVEFSGPMLNDPRTQASLATYVAIFETPDGAHAAYESLVDAHESPEGWNLEPETTSEELGAERVHYAGPAYDRGEVIVYFWRERNAVLAALAWGDTSPTLLIDVARRMDSATRRSP